MVFCALLVVYGLNSKLGIWLGHVYAISVMPVSNLQVIEFGFWIRHGLWFFMYVTV